MRARLLRRLAGHLRGWPLHPQWLLSPREERRALQRTLEPLRGRLLDIGCADGRLRGLLGADVQYIGLDFPATAVGLYRTRPDVFADACRLPLAPESIDAVVLKDVLEHVPGPHLVLGEVARVLRAGGTLVLWMPFIYPIHDAPHDYQRYTGHGLARYLADHGLKVERCEAVLRPLETACLMVCLALGDAVERILARHRWLAWLVPLLVLLVVCTNLLARALRWLPGSGFMPAFYRVLARKASDDDA